MGEQSQGWRCGYAAHTRRHTVLVPGTYPASPSSCLMLKLKLKLMLRLSLRLKVASQISILPSQRGQKAPALAPSPVACELPGRRHKSSVLALTLYHRPSSRASAVDSCRHGVEGTYHSVGAVNVKPGLVSQNPPECFVWMR